MKNRQYKIKRKIGEGTFGRIYVAYHLPTNSKVAIKRIHRVNSLNSREINLLKMLRNEPHIVRLIEEFFTKSNNLIIANIVMEYIDGDLQEEIKKRKRNLSQFSFKELKLIGYQLFLALRSLHKLNIAHRDIKPNNVLLYRDNYLKLTDLGTAKQLHTDRHNSLHMSLP